jgi:hypothetical protein
MVEESIPKNYNKPDRGGWIRKNSADVGIGSDSSELLRASATVLVTEYANIQPMRWALKRQYLMKSNFLAEETSF